MTTVTKKGQTIHWLMETEVGNYQNVEEFIQNFGRVTNQTTDDTKELKSIFAKKIKNLVVKDYAESLNIEEKNQLSVSQIIKVFFKRNPEIFRWFWNYTYDNITGRHRFVIWLLRGYYINAIVAKKESAWMEDQEKTIKKLDEYANDFFKDLVDETTINDLKVSDSQLSAIITGAYGELKNYSYQQLQQKYLHINPNDVCSGFAIKSTVNERCIRYFTIFMKQYTIVPDDFEATLN